MKDKNIILLVEDNPDDEALALRALGRSKIEKTIVVAHDGVEALEYIFGSGMYSNDDKRLMPRVVLLDLKLPRLDGLEVLRRIRDDERTRFLPVVILTSSSEDRDVIESYKLGVNSYVRKPVNFTQFTESIGQLESYWLELNEAVPQTENAPVA